MMTVIQLKGFAGVGVAFYSWIQTPPHFVITDELARPDVTGNIAFAEAYALLS